MDQNAVDLARAQHRAFLVEAGHAREAHAAATARRWQRRAARLAGRAERVSVRADRAASRARLALARAL